MSLAPEHATDEAKGTNVNGNLVGQNGFALSQREFRNGGLSGRNVTRESFYPHTCIVKLEHSDISNHERTVDEPFWFDAVNSVNESRNDDETSSQYWNYADGNPPCFLDEINEMDAVNENILFPHSSRVGSLPANERPISPPPEPSALDDSYDVISETDVATLKTAGSTKTPGGIIPSSSRMLKTMLGLENTERSRQTESSNERHAADRPRKANNADGGKPSFPLRAFLKKHLTASSPSRVTQRRASPTNASSSPSALRRRGVQKEVAVPCGSGSSGHQFYSSVASNSIISQCMTPELESASRRLEEKKRCSSSSPSHHENAVMDRLTEGRGSADPTGNRNRKEELLDNNPSEAVKVRLQSIWNNVKYGWTVKPHMSFSKQQPLWLLGECHKLTEDRELVPSSVDGATLNLSGIDKFRQDFVSRLWFTYRRDFAGLPKEADTVSNAPSSLVPGSLYPRLHDSNGPDAVRHSMPSSSATDAGVMNRSAGEQRVFSTDCGWGCMLRSGQMLLAQALVDHFLGRQWRWHPSSHTSHVSSHEQNEQDFMHRQIIRWCSDSPDSPFSLHSLVKIGHDLGRKAGDWFGPATLAVLMKKALINVHYAERLAPNLLASLSPQSLCRLQQVQIYVARDSTVSVAEINELCTRGYVIGDSDYENLPLPSIETKSGSEEWKYSLILFIPALLGANRLNKMYMHCVEEFLTLPQCCGIIGGRPRHSLYFVGYQTPYLIYLDPHYCQKAVVTSPSRDEDRHHSVNSGAAFASQFPLESFHCFSPRKMPYSKMDPSCTIGFYARNRSEFDALRAQLTEIQKNVCQNYPIFCFVDKPLGGVGQSAKSQQIDERFPGMKSAAEAPSSSVNSQPRSRTIRTAETRRRLDDEAETDSGFVVL